MLATGASHSALTPRLAHTLGLKMDVDNLVMLRGATGTTPVPMVPVRSLEVGELMYEPRKLPIVPDALGGAEGILGVIAAAVAAGDLELGIGHVIMHTLLSAGGESTTSLLGNAMHMRREGQRGAEHALQFGSVDDPRQRLDALRPGREVERRAVGVALDVHVVDRAAGVGRQRVPDLQLAQQADRRRAQGVGAQVSRR